MSNVPSPAVPPATSRRRARSGRMASCGLALLPLAGSPATAAPEIVGRAGAVNPATTAVAGGGAARVLELGANVIFRERVTTSAAGTAQLIFVDKTTLSIGPNASLVIDEFVYNPSAGTGTMAVSLARGLVRFVGGNTSHTGGATVTTPVATIGIRGGIATVRHDPGGTTRAILHFGYMTVTTAQGTETVRRPGFGVTIAGNGAVSAPEKTTLAEVADDRETLTSKGQQRGGAPVSPTDRGAVRAGIDGVNRSVTPGTEPYQKQAVASRSSPNASTTVQNLALILQGSTSSPLTLNAAARSNDAAVQAQVVARSALAGLPAGGGTGGSPVPVVTPSGGTLSGAAPAAGITAASTSTASAASGVTSSGSPSPAGAAPGTTSSGGPSSGGTATVPVPRPGRFALNTTIDPALNSTVPYVLGAAVASGGVSISPVYGYRAASRDGVTAGPTRTLQVAFGINGSGTSQTSNFMVATGRLLTQPDGSPILAGGFAFAGRRAANLTMGRANGNVTQVPGSLSTDAQGLPTGLRVDQNYFNGTAVTSDTAYERPGGGGPSQTYTYQQTLTATTAPATLGQSRQTGTFSGYAAGMVRTLDVGTQQNINELAQPITGTATLQTDAATSRVQLNMGLTALNQTSRPAGAYLNGTVQLGSLGTSDNPRSTYIDDSTFGARAAATNITATSETPASRVNNAALTGDVSLTAVSTAISGLQQAFPNVQFCQCEYTRWGFWSEETNRPGYADRIHLGTWVSGTATAATDMPVSGTATYTGHVMAAMRSGGSEFVAGSNMTNVANFATQSITSTVSSLNGVSYAGTMRIVNQTGITGTLTGAGGYTMNTTGNFFGPGAAELAGSLSLTGPNNLAGAGIFQTRR
ncbi:MAG: FecR domain-containing protein [Parafilimonas terrae]|nr:FecR domain-containing protein [Parafilimonas terrae]